MPVFSTKQERGLAALGRLARHNRKVVVAASYRGARKSWTCQRLGVRGVFALRWHKFIYVDNLPLFEWFYPENKSFVERLARTVRMNVFQTIAAMLIAVVWVCIRNKPRARSSENTSTKSTVAGTKKEAV